MMPTMPSGSPSQLTGSNMFGANMYSQPPHLIRSVQYNMYSQPPTSSGQYSTVCTVSLPPRQVSTVQYVQLASHLVMSVQYSMYSQPPTSSGQVSTVCTVSLPPHQVSTVQCVSLPPHKVSTVQYVQSASLLSRSVQYSMYNQPSTSPGQYKMDVKLPLKKLNTNWP